MLAGNEQTGPAAIADLAPQLGMQLAMLEGMQAHLAMVLGEARGELLGLRTDSRERRKVEGSDCVESAQWTSWLRSV